MKTNWWRRWKAKHWDEGPANNSGIVFRVHGDFPPLRRVARWLAAQWAAKPLECLMTAAAVVASVAAVIALLR